MSADKVFLDTNILVYLYSGDDIDKQHKSLIEFNKFERFVSTQVLTEFCSIGYKKLRLSVSDIRDAVSLITAKCGLIVLHDTDLCEALKICARYKYSYYDSLVIYSALEAGCNFLFSEDMHDGQIIEGTLKIRNIYKD